MSGKTLLSARVLGEVLLIVVSVLIAFQLEGMREASDTRSRTETQLRALLADLRDNHRRLQDIVRRQQGVIDAGRAVVRIGNGNDPMQPVDSMVTVISRASQFFRLEPVTGAYDALVASGDLRLIRNDTLRSSLANFMSDVRDGHEDEDVTQLLRTELIGALSESTSFLSVQRPALRGFADLPESTIPPDIEALLSNQRYMSFLTLLTSVEAVILSYFERLEDEASSLIDMVEQELSEAA